MTASGRTLTDLKAAAEETGVPLHALAGDGGCAVVVPAWGGRILFLGTGEANTLWTSPDFANNGLWPANYGGCRSWFSPEGGPKGIYFSADWSDWQCPPAMDPGDYKPVGETNGRRIALENQFQATSNDGTAYHLRMGRTVELGAAPDLPEGVACVPIHFAHSYVNLSDRTVDREIDLWHLVQIIPGGTILVPLAAGSDQPYRDYFEPVPADRVAVQGACLSVAIDGARRYKLGVNQRSAAGAIAYLRTTGDTASLLVKRFAVDAAGVYADRPEADQERNGDPIQLYNHMTGGPEGFGEIECHAPAVTLAPQARQEFSIELDLLEGPRNAVLEAGSALIDRDLAQVKLFE